MGSDSDERIKGYRWVLFAICFFGTALTGAVTMLMSARLLQPIRDQRRYSQLFNSNFTRVHASQKFHAYFPFIKQIKTQLIKINNQAVQNKSTTWHILM